MSLCPSILLSFKRLRSGCSKGFTLIEVMVAISIFALAITSIYGVFSSISATKDRLDRNSETYHQGRVILDRIGREIHGIYFHDLSNTYILRGGFNEKNEVFFELSTTATTSLDLDGLGFASVRYELIEDQNSADGSYVIMRRERPLLGSISRQNFPAIRTATGIKSFKVRYFADNSWQDQWDNKLQGFPERLEILLTAYDKSGEETQFLTAFKCPTSGVAQ